MKPQKLINFIFYPLLVICVSISTFAFYFGIEQTLGQLTLPGTIVIALMLFGSTLAINEARFRKNGQLIGPFVLFAVALIFSTASNFNYFYTRYFQLDLSRSTARTALHNFKLDIGAARTALDADQKLTQVVGLRGEIDKGLLSLRNEITDPLNSGAGPKAQGIINDLKRRLPSLTLPTLPGTRDKDELLKWYASFEKIVYDHLALAANANQKDYLALARDMNDAYAFYTNAVEALHRAADAPALVPDMLEEMSRKMVEYTAAVNKLVTVGPKEWKPPHSIDPEAGRVGDIVRTISSVFKDGGDPRIALWAIIVSLFIDLAPIFYSFLAVRKIEDGPDISRPRLQSGFQTINR